MHHIGRRAKVDLHVAGVAVVDFADEANGGEAVLLLARDSARIVRAFGGVGNVVDQPCRDGSTDCE